MNNNIMYNNIYNGDSLTVLKNFPDEFIDCCVTSPPYYRLRNYNIDGQIGLEETPDAYVQKLVEVFREVKRVLKKEGTCWLNLGDSFNNDKQLVGIPWRVAFALQADGWYLRSDIIWYKSNPMPESVRDRPTKSHEYVFLLTKSKKYFYDNDAVKENAVSAPHARKGVFTPEQTRGPMDRRGNSQYDIESQARIYGEDGKRSLRSVWSIPTKPNHYAHFAVFPEALVEPCVKAGTSEKGCCATCGKPYVREVERVPMVIRKTDRMCVMGEFGRTQSSGTMLSPASSRTVGWKPSCDCKESTVPSVVLDPFMGSGTVALVSKRLGRNYIGIELNNDYIDIANKRITRLEDEVRYEKQSKGTDIFSYLNV